jgi:hypothetical protein
MEVMVVEDHDQQRLTLLIWSPAFSEHAEMARFFILKFKCSIEVVIRSFK